MKKKKYNSKKNTLIIADTQFPFEHRQYLDFCKAVQEKYRCGEVVHIGDIADCLNFSFYEKDPEAPAILEEVELLKASFEAWGKAFPNVKAVVGNHDNRVRRRLDSAGFPHELLPTEKVFRDLLGLPKGWSLQDKVILDTRRGEVYCLHGDQKGSSVVAGTTARKIGTSLIRGHHHTKSFITYISTPHHLIFDMIVGCGIDKNAVAFRYNKKDIDRPILSCGVILDGIPHIIPMELDSDGNWLGKL